jgi:myosin-3
MKTKPPETIKHGQLKTDRKTRHQPLIIEDLASLEDLNQQIVVDMLCKRFMR